MEIVYGKFIGANQNNGSPGSAAVSIAAASAVPCPNLTITC
jgi:hypothetical protein